MVTRTPTVSAIVPVFNGERFVGDTLASILAQTQPVHELLVIDDGSTDDTAQVVTSFGKAVRYMHQPNRGPAAARNHGIRLATGDLLAFLDADDQWHPEKVAVQWRRLVEAPAVDLSFTRFRNTWEPELEAERVAFASNPLARPISGWCIGTLMARRQAFETWGPFDEALRQGENISWFLDAARAGARIEVMEEVLMLRRFHPTSLTRRAAPETLDGFLDVLRKWKDGPRIPRPPS